MAASREPQNLNDRSWYYEYPTYLWLVHEVRDGTGNYVCSENIKIPWRMLKRSMARAYKPRKRTKR